MITRRRDQAGTMHTLKYPSSNVVSMTTKISMHQKDIKEVKRSFVLIKISAVL